MRAGATGTWPSVSVVIPTRDRAELVARAIEAVLAQDYPGIIECVVVFDQSEPHPIEAAGVDGARRLLVRVRNDRTPGLAGARNSGILATTGDVVGFCDDDDEWLPGKLERQMALWEERPEATVVATGVQVRNEQGDHDRLAPPVATFDDFLASRIMEINPCTLLVRRVDLFGPIGLVDEAMPNSFGEDYEWLLRATRVGDIHSVPDPLVRIYWNRPSFFMGRWQGMVDGLTYLLEAVPEFDRHPRGKGRVEGQIAFALAAMGHRRESLRWANRSLRHKPTELRALASIAVVARLVDPERLVAFVQRRGRGL